MRQLLHQHRWVCYFVAGLLLFATSGTTLSRMSCLMGGHSVLSYGTAADCCPDEHDGEGSTVTATCCDLTEARLDQAHMVVEEPLVMEAPAMIICGLAVPQERALTGDCPHWLDGRPPPQSVPARLALLRTRLV